MAAILVKSVQGSRIMRKPSSSDVNICTMVLLVQSSSKLFKVVLISAIASNDNSRANLQNGSMWFIDFAKVLLFLHTCKQNENILRFILEIFGQFKKKQYLCKPIWIKMSL